MNIRKKLKFFFLGKNSKSNLKHQRAAIEKRLVRSWGEKRMDMNKLISWFCSTIKCISNGDYEEFIFSELQNKDGYDEIIRLAKNGDELYFDDEESQTAYNAINKAIFTKNELNKENIKQINWFKIEEELKKINFKNLNIEKSILSSSASKSPIVTKTKMNFP